ncbi:MurR/RpiR family transcriptional regulator [Microbulbifer sp. S227A]|uniref:MurR/RpiR family transcriptional regulator n=1 Tax=Microbulbifer sp. S227A TaxID=3415131 RepID=UPI003C7A8C4B
MDILEKLQKELPGLPKKLALAARYALDTPDRIALNSMRSAAAEVGVTSTTMLRLARQMGFDSYDDFKACFQDKLLTTGFGARAGALRHQNASDTSRTTLTQEMLAASTDNLAGTLNEANLQHLSRVARLMREAPAVYLVGSGSLFWLASIMKTTGSMILPNLRLVGTEFAVAAEGLSQVTGQDVVIGFGVNPCATRTIEAMRFVRARGAHVVAMTDRPSSPLTEHAEFTFCAGTQSPHYYPSITAMMALVEMMLATVVAEGGAIELDRIKALEAHRKASASYCEY